MNSREKLKKIRLEIKQARFDGNQELMLEKLADFQQFNIDQEFTFGHGEIYRYAKTLQRLGFEEEALKQTKIVENAVLVCLKKFKRERIEQVKYFDYFRFSCSETDKEQQCGCTRLDGIIDKTDNIEDYKAWIHCSAKRCTVAIYGESEKSLKRKGLMPM